MKASRPQRGGNEFPFPRRETRKLHALPELFELGIREPRPVAIDNLVDEILVRNFLARKGVGDVEDFSLARQ